VRSLSPLAASACTLALALAAAGCGGEEEPALAAVDPGPAGLAVLGDYTHSASAVDVQVVMGKRDGLAHPSDVAINPSEPGQLWVTNHRDDSIVVGFGLGADGVEESEAFSAFGSEHFLAKPMALAFTDSGRFATIHDTDEKTQGEGGTPEDFMGPTLWDDNMDMFDGGHGGHLDMLHNSPLGGGIAWDQRNAFWVFDGYNRSITYYDFKEDHDYAGADHSDGVVRRYVEGEVKRKRKVPSHLELDRETQLLYIADTGNSRIAVLDTTTGKRGDEVGPNYDGTDQVEWKNASLWSLVEDAEISIGMTAPAGLALHDGTLYVSDHDAGRILAFDLQGNLLDWLDLDVGEGALGGIDFDADGALYVTDMAANEVLRITPL
jgi:DNA-binding beta-propeller fold protein YncE